MIGISYGFILLISIIIWSVYRIIVNKKNKNISILREVVISLFFIYFLAVIYFTICKGGLLNIAFKNNVYINLIPFKETMQMFNNEFMGIGNALYNIMGNIIMFIPLGFFIPFLFESGNKFNKVLLYSLCASITIEMIQLLTSINITDIDDVIFNTLGGVIGLVMYRSYALIFGNTKIGKIFNSIKDFTRTDLIKLAFKPIGSIFIIVVVVSVGYLYGNTVSENSSDDEMLKAFSYTAYGDALLSRVQDDKKYILIKYDGYLNLMEYIKVLGNRYSPGTSIQMEGEDGYIFNYVQHNLGNEVNQSYQVFGKNKKAASIEITCFGETYRENLEEDQYFIVVTPFYKVKEVGNEGNLTEDVKIKFLDSYGNEYKEMELK